MTTFVGRLAGAALALAMTVGEPLPPITAS